MMKSQQTITLNNGIVMPKIGLGTYKITDSTSSIEAIKYAINIGYMMLDTADYYQNHHLIAKAIKESDKRREELFITSKIWPNTNDKKALRAQIQKMLHDLNTDYLDLVLVHWPLPYGLEAYQILEEFYDQGMIKAIGVSNYNVEQLKALLKVAKIKPTVNQIELHPNALRKDIVNFCNQHQITVISWQTLMKGEVGDLPHISKLANKYGVDPAAIALNWALQQNIIVIPKSVTLSRIKSNLLNIDTFDLTTNEIETIDFNSAEVGPHINSEEFQAI